MAREIEIIEQWVLAQESTFSETDHGIYYSFDNPNNRPVLDVENLQKIYESVFSKVIHNRNIIRHWESDEFLEELKSRHEDFPDHSSF